MQAEVDGELVDYVKKKRGNNEKLKKRGESKNKRLCIGMQKPKVKELDRLELLCLEELKPSTTRQRRIREEVLMVTQQRLEESEVEEIAKKRTMMTREAREDEREASRIEMADELPHTAMEQAFEASCQSPCTGSSQVCVA